MIPARWHKPMKYRPRLCPLWAPDMERNVITLEHKVHFFIFGSDSIQWAVIPMNEAFVCGTDHSSIVVETRPDEFACKMY